VQFAATISRLSTLSATLAPLPPDCSFTLVVELREDSDALIGAGGSSQSWIAADRSLQRRKGEGREGGGLLRGGEGRRTGEEEDGWVREEVVEERAKREQQQQQQRLGGVDEADGGPTDPLSRPAHPRTTPVRNVEAGAFVMEVWVEEGPDKAAAIAAHAADEARKERERERR
jgi:mitotic spindle assembly checkpoint protein MAD2B